MNVSTITQEDRLTLRLKGRFEFTAHRDFSEAIKQHVDNPKIKKIVIDLGDVEYIDSSALGMLLLARERAGTAGKSIALSRASGSVKQVLDVANFQKIFAIE